MTSFAHLSSADLRALAHAHVRLADNYRELPIHPNWIDPAYWRWFAYMYHETLRGGRA